MRIGIKKNLAAAALIFLLPAAAKTADLGKKLTGRILLNVEAHGEAWYVWPENNRRYFLGRPGDAFAMMRQLGLGISEIDFQRLAQAGMPVAGDVELARRLAGRIVLQVEKNGEAWYIYPVDLKKYYLGRPEDAFRIMRFLSLGITRENLARIHKATLNESVNVYSRYQHKAIKTAAGNFTIDVVEIDLANPHLKIITDTTMLHPTAATDKRNGYYAAKSLGEFIGENNGFAGINGTYFCSSAWCEANNYYFFPVYNSNLKKMINYDQLKYWTTGPLIAFDEHNKFYYYKDSRDFPAPGWSEDLGLSVSDAFAQVNGVRLQAAIGNKPRLIENGMNVLIDWELDRKQRYVKAERNAIGYKNGQIYLVAVRSATIPDLAEVLKAMRMEYALNIDGGNSSALWYNDEYMVGPGRDIPNAIIFKDAG